VLAFWVVAVCHKTHFDEEFGFDFDFNFNSKGWIYWRKIILSRIYVFCKCTGHFGDWIEMNATDSEGILRLDFIVLLLWWFVYEGCFLACHGRSTFQVA
jgi:hypothetical protein